MMFGMMVTKHQREKFVTPLKHGDKRSKILITTRQGSIAQMIANVLLTEEKKQNLSTLSNVDSVSLFKKHVFAGVNPDYYRELQEIGDKIVKKCGGVPLFVKLMAGLLRMNLDYSNWERIWKDDILNSDEQTREGFDLLKISYRHLPPNIQACFRICSIFPQDYGFKRDELVEMWIGAGLIQPYKNEHKLVEEIGDEYLKSLQARFFFEFRENEFISYYVMHDLIHDLARDVSKGECFAINAGDNLIDIPKTLRHISIRQPNDDLIKHLSNFQKLRTVYIDCNEPSTIVNKLLEDALMQLKSLRLIRLRNVKEFNSNAIRHLIHLRHLDCSTISSDIEHLFYEPAIYKLCHLQFLSHFCGDKKDTCSSFELGGIGNLIKLRNLHVSDSVFKKLTNIRHLTELQEVDFYIKKEGDYRLSDLMHLNKLRRLSISGIQNLTTPEKAKEFNLIAKKYLKKLSLFWKDKVEQKFCWLDYDTEFFEELLNPKFDEEVHDPKFDEDILDHLHPHSHIKELKLSNYKGRRVSSWITAQHLSTIETIKLEGCWNLECLPPLGQMPFLKYLEMSRIHAMKQTGMDFYGGEGITSFPSLKTLTIEDVENLEEWTGADNADWFPCLKKLRIKNCCKLNGLPTLLLYLEELHLNNIGLTSSPKWLTSNVEREGSMSSSLLPNQLCQLSLEHLAGISISSILVFFTLTSLHSISLWDLKNLTSLDGLHGLTSLRELSIMGCNNFVRAAAIHTDDEQVASTSSSQPLSLFPLLDTLMIDDVELLKIEPLRRITSVRYLSILFDEKMESLAAAEEWLLQNTTSLTEISLSGTLNLLFLPSTFQSLCSSLKCLCIRGAPLLESQPDLPSSLQELRTCDCPLLKERYQKEGGPDWHHISYINNVCLG